MSLPPNRLPPPQVTLKHVAIVDLTSLNDFYLQQHKMPPRDAMQVLDVVVRHAFAATLNCTLIGRSIFFTGCLEARPIRFGSVEVIQGVKQAIKATEAGVRINVDATFGAFLAECELGELLFDSLNRRDGDLHEFHVAAKKLVGFKIQFP
ncbi:hypothetical protein Vretimale_13870, partial [Volvox reticuliferus]